MTEDQYGPDLLKRDKLQQRISEIQWYHEFDFGNGLVARPQTKDLATHRKLWKFIQGELDKIDFSGKSVLDIGCWDGYWSFYAERRGAARVLATDDTGQNWAGEAGFLLARECLKSAVDYDLNRSVYNLVELDTKFDIILCLGVYYHLIDPFYAFSQIRHCCNENSLVLFEGDVFFGLPEGAVLYSRDVRKAPRFVPDLEALRCFINAAYFAIETETVLPLSQVPGPGVGRVLMATRAFVGENKFHDYRPPFGLHLYDRRRDVPSAQWSDLQLRSRGKLGAPFVFSYGIYDDEGLGWRWASPMAQIEAGRIIVDSELTLFSEVPNRLKREQTVMIHGKEGVRASVILSSGSPVSVRLGPIEEGEVLTLCSADFFVPAQCDPNSVDTRLLSFALKISESDHGSTVTSFGRSSGTRPASTSSHGDGPVLRGPGGAVGAEFRLSGIWNWRMREDARFAFRAPISLRRRCLGEAVTAVP